MSNIQTVVVTIGRNVGDHPMPSMRWAAYVNDIHTALAKAGTILSYPVVGSDQVGEWAGQREQSAVFVAFVPHEVLFAVRETVRLLRIGFGQEAAGFIVADGTDNLA